MSSIRLPAPECESQAEEAAWGRYKTWGLRVLFAAHPLCSTSTMQHILSAARPLCSTSLIILCRPLLKHDRSALDALYPPAAVLISNLSFFSCCRALLQSSPRLVIWPQAQLSLFLLPSSPSKHQHPWVPPSCRNLALTQV